MCKKEDSVPFDMEISDDEVCKEVEVIYTDENGNEFVQ